MCRSYEELYKEAIELTKRLVSIPSVIGNEREISEFLSDWLTDKGLIARRDEVGNVISVSGEGPLYLLYNGHMDTVPPQPGWTRDPFDPVIEEDKLYGLGSSDMKGGLAAMAVAYAELANCTDLPLIYTAVVREEGGDETPDNMRGALHLAKTFLKGKKAVGIVGEGSVDRDGRLIIRIGHNGKLRMRVRVRGIAGHGSRPDYAVNAIYLAMEIVRAFKESYDYTNPIKIPKVTLDSEIRPPLSVNIFKAGEAINQIPNEAEFLVDRRVVYGEDIEELRKRYSSLVEHIIGGLRQELAPRLGELGRDIGADIEEVGMNRPPYMLPDTREAIKLLDIAKKVVESIEGRVDLSYGTGYTDAEILWSFAGIPSIILGPGARAHVQDEYLDLAPLKKVVRAYMDIPRLMFQ